MELRWPTRLDWHSQNYKLKDFVSDCFKVGSRYFIMCQLGAAVSLRFYSIFLCLCPRPGQRLHMHSTSRNSSSILYVNGVILAVSLVENI